MRSRLYRYLAIVATIVVFALLVSGCGDDGTTTSSEATSSTGGEVTTSTEQASTTAPGQAEGDIVIGIAKAKTGGFAIFDMPGGQGSVLAIDAVNAAGGIGGRKLSYLWEDTASDPALAGEAAEKLISQGAEFIIAPSDFDVGVGASMASEEAGLVGICPEASSVDWPTAVGPHFFIQAVTTIDLGVSEGAFADSKGWKNAYVITNEAYNFFTDQEKYFNETFTGEVVGRDAVAESATDYSAVVSKIRDASTKPDFVLLLDYFPHVGTFIKQLRDAGVDTPVLGNPTFSSQDLASVVGKDRVSEVYYTSQCYYEGEGVDPSVAEVVSAYQEEFGVFPENLNVISGYAGVLMLADAIEAAGSTDADAVSAAMSAQTNLEMPGFKVIRWTDNHTESTVSVIGYDESGNFLEVTRIDPTTVE